MKKFVVTKQFDGPISKDYPAGTVIKAEYCGNGFVSFGKVREKNLSVTGVQNFDSHTKPAKN